MFPPRLIHPAPKPPAPPVRRCGSFPETLATGCCAGGPDEGKLLLLLLLGFAQMLAGGCELEDMATSRWDDTQTVIWHRRNAPRLARRRAARDIWRWVAESWMACPEVNETNEWPGCLRKAGDPTHKYKDR